MTLQKIFHILFHVKIAILDSIEEVVDRSLIIFHAHIKEHEIRCAYCRSKNVRREASQTRRFRGCNLGDKKPTSNWQPINFIVGGAIKRDG